MSASSPDYTLRGAERDNAPVSQPNVFGRAFKASIEGGVGEATVMLPSGVGVKAKAQGGLGKINAEGLERVGDAYVNDAYGESNVTLNVDVQGGVGEINLEVV